MFIPRTSAEAAARFASQYPVVAILGPRQSGKTTLARAVFHEKPYASLEDLDNRAFAEEDPRGFLARFPDGAILDEIQRAPFLLSYLQTLVDQDKRMGLFVLTGSHQLDIFTGTTQSLAGRVALLTLLPFSLGELQNARRAPDRLDDLLFKGLYPPIYDRSLEAAAWYGNYIRTYLERDLRQIINVRDLNIFQRFVRLCAARTGQLLNLSDLAGDAGITHTTARSWISVLEASYVIHLLQPHHRNFSKRIVKSPKLYFYDTGLAAQLLGIDTPDELAIHSLRGPLFETWVLNELLKVRTHMGKRPNVFFWRDRSGNEVDILIESGGRLTPVETKSGRTPARDFDAALKKWSTIAGAEAGESWVVYGGEESFDRSGTHFLCWRDLPASKLAE